MLLSAGLRRNECAAVKLGNYTFDTGTLRGCGKSDSHPLTNITGGATPVINDWLSVSAQDDSLVLAPVGKGGALTLRSMTGQTIYNVKRKRAYEARVKDFSPHDLRRTFVREPLDAATAGN